MTYRRRSIRLPHYDYSRAGYYFITVTTHKRVHLFGEIEDGVMVLNVAGEMIHRLWYEIEEDFPCVALHDFVIMPNHIHGIIEIKHHNMPSNPVGADSISALPSNNQPHNISPNPVGAESISTHPSNNQPRDIPSKRRAEIDSAPTLFRVMQSFKRHTTLQYIQMVKNNTLPSFDKRIWQRNYYEHVVRDANDYARIAEYIRNNPLTWEEDMLYT